MMAGIVSDDDFRARLQDSTFTTSGTHYPVNTQVHTVVVLDFGLSGNELKVYFNGETTPTLSYNVTGTALSSMSGAIMSLGASASEVASSRANPIIGKLADVRVWLDAATGDEVASIYANTLGTGGGTASLPPFTRNPMAHLIGR